MNKINNILMSAAETWSLASTCERSKVGCVISMEKRIISTGYNGTLTGSDNHCEDDGLTKNEVVHAEQNAITFCAKNGLKTADCELFTTLSPCETCAKLIISAGIKTVYYRNEYRDKKGLILLNKFNVKTIKI